MGPAMIRDRPRRHYSMVSAGPKEEAVHAGVEMEVLAVIPTGLVELGIAETLA